MLTPVGRVSSPLLRYRTGDLVKPSWKGYEQFGRNELALLGGILGRIDDMVCIRGMNIYPSTIDEVVCRFQEVEEYQVTVRKSEERTQIEIAVEFTSGTNTTAMINQIELALRDVLYLRIPVHSVEPNSLPRFELKAKRWKQIETFPDSPS